MDRWKLESKGQTGTVMKAIGAFALMAILIFLVSQIMGFGGLPLVGFIGIIGGIIFIVAGLVSDSPIFGFATGFGLISGILALQGTPFAMFAFFLMILVGVVTGLPVPSARPLIGIPLLFLALMSATTAYPSVMGEAVFGGWWPTVNAQIQGFQESMGPAMGGFTDIQTSLGRGWTCLASPAQCYQMYQPKTKTEKGYRALTITKFQPLGIGKITSPPSSDNPYELQVLVQVDNQLTSEKVDDPPTIEPVTIEIKELKSMTEKTNPKEQKTIASAGKKLSGTDCSPNGGTCDSLKFYPGFAGTYTGTYKVTEALEPGRYVQYGVGVNYPVKSGGALDVEILNSREFDRLARRNELDFHEPTSTFEWGPASIGLAASRLQPIEEKSSVPIIVSLTNRGGGYITSIEEVKVKLNGLAEEEKLDLTEDLSNILQTKIDNYDKNVEGLKPQDSLIASEMVEVTEIDVPRKTYGLTVNVKYDYTFSETGFIGTQYECNDNDDCSGEKNLCRKDKGICVNDCNLPSTDCSSPDFCMDGKCVSEKMKEKTEGQK